MIELAVIAALERSREAASHALMLDPLTCGRFVRLRDQADD